MFEDEKLIESFITTITGTSGAYAVHLGRFEKKDGTTYLDIIQTGLGGFHKKGEDAEVEAKEWAKAVGVEYSGR